MTAPSLKPRAIAALCALRQGPLAIQAVCTRIGDRRTDDTEELIRDMIALRLVVWVGTVSLHLDHEGLGWLQSNGLDADPGGLRVVGREARVVKGLDDGPDGLSVDRAIGGERKRRARRPVAMSGVELDHVRRTVLEAVCACWPYSGVGYLRDETASAIADRVREQLEKAGRP